MKKTLFILLACWAIAGCRKDDFGNGFEMIYSFNLEVDAGISPAFSHSYTIENIPTQITNTASLNGFTVDDVTKINSKFLRVDMVAPASGEYNYLENVYLEVKTDSLGPIEIGYLEFLPNNTDGTLNLIPSQTDLIDYLTGERFDLIFRLDPRVPPSFTSNNRINVTFHAFVE